VSVSRTRMSTHQISSVLASSKYSRYIRSHILYKQNNVTFLDLSMAAIDLLIIRGKSAILHEWLYMCNRYISLAMAHVNIIIMKNINVLP